MRISDVELMALAAHVHGGFFLGGGDGGEVGIDVILPKAEPGKNVRRHMQGVRRGGSQLRIFPSRRQSLLRHAGLVVGVDQVMGDARMIGFFGEQFLKHSRSLL